MQWFNDFKASVARGVSQFKNKAFKSAAMAICARIACADGKIEASELEAAKATIAGIDELKAFDPNELYALFQEFCGKITANKHLGRAVCDRAILGIKGKNEACVMALGVALAIAYADGTFQPEEQKVFKECCALINMDPAPYLPEDTKK